MTLTVFRAGNSDVLTIPVSLSRKYGLNRGSKAQIVDVGNGILVQPARDQRNIRPEFDQWLEKFSQKYSQALTKLAEL